MTAQRCDYCQGPLYTADLLCNLTTCSECARRAIKASRRPPRERTVPKRMPSTFGVSPEDWATFLTAARSVAVNGEVHSSDMRPLLRGRLHHKTIGRCYKRAKAAGIFEVAGREQSDDTIGKNTHVLEPYYRLNEEVAGAPVIEIGQTA